MQDLKRLSRAEKRLGRRRGGRSPGGDQLSKIVRAERKLAENSSALDSAKFRAFRASAPWGRRILKPFPGAQSTVSQVVQGQNFVTHTGLIGGSNELYMVNTGGFAAAFAFSLADLPQSASYTALYDQYRFERILLRLIPVSNVIDNHTTSAVNTVQNPTHLVADFDDDGALGSENAALEYDQICTIMPYSGIEVEFVPHVAAAAFAGGAFSGYLIRPSTDDWVDVANTGVKFYGVKAWVGSLQATATSIAGWTVYAQYTVSFKNIR